MFGRNRLQDLGGRKGPGHVVLRHNSTVTLLTAGDDNQKIGFTQNPTRVFYPSESQVYISTGALNVMFCSLW